MEKIHFTTEKVHDGYIKVNSCGEQWLGDRDYNTIRENGRVDFSIHYVRKGCGSFLYDGKSYPIPAGSLILHFPGVKHDYTFKKNDNSQILWAHFSGDACDVLTSFPSDMPVVLSVNDRKQFELVFDKMIAAYHQRLIIGEQLCDSYMPVLLALITQPSITAGQDKANHTDERMEKVLSKMHREFNKPIDIQEYASICHLSKDRFIRTFKAYTGFPPYHYQLKIRIERAVDMLENTAYTIAQCGEIVGFSDNAYFCRIFKKITGHPPSFYKYK